MVGAEYNQEYLKGLNEGYKDAIIKTWYLDEMRIKELRRLYKGEW